MVATAACVSRCSIQQNYSCAFVSDLLHSPTDSQFKVKMYIRAKMPAHLRANQNACKHCTRVESSFAPSTHSIRYIRDDSTQFFYLHTLPPRCRRLTVLLPLAIPYAAECRRTKIVLQRVVKYLYKWASVQFCRSKDQLGSQAGVPARQMAGPNPQKGPTNILELL